MKKILLTSVAFVGLAGTAFAADLPRRSAPAPFVAVPAFTWTGFYVGVNAGYGWNNSSNDSVFVPAGAIPGFAGGTITFSDGDDGGFVGGGQIGYNYQIGQFVLGLEADIQYADLSRDRGTFVLAPAAGFPAGFVAAGPGGIDWFGTVRARAGFAIDRALIYATGGFAYGGGDNGGAFGGGDDTSTGWTVGGGIEYAFTNNLTAKIEGLYVNLDRNNNGVAGFTAAGAPVIVAGSSRGDLEFGVVRAGLNYKFSTY